MSTLLFAPRINEIVKRLFFLLKNVVLNASTLPCHAELVSASPRIKRKTDIFICILWNNCIYKTTLRNGDAESSSA